MNRLTKLSNFRSPSEAAVAAVSDRRPEASLHRSKTGATARWRPAKLNGEQGYAFLILMMMVTILLVSLTAALPSIYTEGQREKEEELIFRGNEYAHAIMLFRRRFNRFPASVKELLQTNGIRFLRHDYTEPMTRSGKWRFIHANAAGALLDSKTMKIQGQGQAQPRAQALGGQQAGAPNNSTNPPADSLEGLSAQLEGDTEAQQEANQLEKELEAESSGELIGPGNQIQGAFIAGVASFSRHKSIRVWNKQERYDKWEFLGIETYGPGVLGGAVGGAPGAAASPSPLGQPQTPQIPTMPPLSQGIGANQ